ncbi:MAG TPA: hypothetical protein PLK77_05550 [Pyrinomonadaceae bacterium]|nr:hypothetical protein [Pyrinomonadaceae bacterium]
MAFRRLLAVSCLVFALAGAVLGQAEPKEEFVNLYRIIDSGSCAEIDEILARSESKATLRASKAECHLTLGQLAPARESLLASLADPSIHVGTFIKVHGLLYKMQLHDDGLRTASEFIARNQFVFEAYNRRSIVNWTLGNYEVAIEDMISAAKIANGRGPIDIGSLVAISKLPPSDGRLPGMYRRIYTELKPLVDSAVKRRESIPPGEFVSPEILNTISNLGRIARFAANYEARMYDARGLDTEREKAFDRMVDVEPKFLSYGIRAGFYKEKGLSSRAKECTRLMYFYLTHETSREIRIRILPKFAYTSTQADPDRGRKLLANLFMSRGKYYHLSANPDLARSDFDKALELDPDLQVRIEKILAEAPE